MLLPFPLEICKRNCDPYFLPRTAHTDRMKFFLFVIIKNSFIFWRKSVTNIPVSDVYIMSSLSFKASVDHLACMLYCLGTDSPLVQHLLTSCQPAFQLILSTYLFFQEFVRVKPMQQCTVCSRPAL